MTVPASTRKAGPYTGNGVTTVFAFTFKVFAKTDVQVVVTDSTGTPTTLVLDSDYSLVLNVDQDATPGGSITYPIIGSPLPAISTLTMIGAMTVDQLLDITNGGRFLPQVVENAYDKLTIIAQQQQEVLGRTLRAAVGTNLNLVFPAASSGKFIRWRTDLTGLENAEAGTDSTVLQGLLADSAVNTRGAGMSGFTQSLTYPASTVGDRLAAISDQTNSAKGASLLAVKSTKTGAVGRTVAAKLLDVVSVLDFSGVDPTGTTDSAAGIQAAIDSLGTGGGRVLFPPGIYKVGTTLFIGNGTTSVASTVWGIFLEGTGSPPLPAGMFSGFPSTGGVKLLWAGGAFPLISVRGPLNGWGVINMYLDGASLATRAISVTSASYGQNRNLALTNFVDAAVYETTLASFAGFGLANTMHNHWANLSINVPAVAGAKGIVLTGTPSATPTPVNACYEHFTNTLIYLPPTLTTYGVYLQWTDSDLFEDLHIFGGSASAVMVQLDYTLSNNMPSSNGFVGVDPSGTGTNVQFANSGAPGAGARPNWVKGLGEINLGVQPNLPNLAPDLPMQLGRTTLTGQTAALSNVALYTPYAAGLYRVSYYMLMTSGGTGGTISLSVNFNDSFTGKSHTSVAINANGTAPFYTHGMFVFQAAAAAAITYTVTFAGVTGSPVYAVYMTLERIG